MACGVLFIAAVGCISSGSENLFHADFLRFQIKTFIKAKSRNIIRPDIQRHIVASDAAGIVAYIVIQLMADFLMAAVCINAQIINIERADIGKNIVMELLDQNAEGISAYFSFIIFINVIKLRRDKNRIPCS